MRSLTISFSKGLKKGRVQMERYHLHVLKTVRETKYAIQYVLFNQQKHEIGTYSEINEYSSVLFLASGLDLVRRFAKEKRFLLKISRGDPWIPDLPQSYLAKKAI
jgi:hypothetical protein